jgi:hypothetical protein
MTTFVPKEFVGLARQFIRDAGTAAEAASTARRKVLDPAFQRLLRYPLRPMRDGALAALARAWEALPTPFRVGFETGIDRRGRKGWIAEMEALPALLTSAEWNNDASEPALMIAAFRFEAPATNMFAHHDYRSSHAIWAMSTIGMHALARRYERGGDRSHTAVIRDLSALAHANIHDSVRFPSGGEFRIPAGKGAWCGVTEGVTLTEREELSTVQFVVRTFIA